MTYGLLSTGFVPASIDDLRAAIEADERSLIDANIETHAESPIGALNSVVVTRLRELWELGESIYSARDPKSASFASLDALAQLTGTTRNGATFGLVTLSVTLNAGVTLPQGSIASVSGQPTNRWATTVAVTNSGGSPATFSVLAKATTSGTITANAGTITVIATPVTGWTAVTNALDASPGSPAESDTDLRLRRERDLSNPGEATLPAMYAHLSEVAVNGVVVVASVTVEENASAYTDSLGRPPHSVEAIVQFTAGLTGPDLDAARQAFAQQLWNSKPGGIDTDGSHSATVTDVKGATHTVYWTEPTLVPIYVSVVLQIDPTAYGGDSTIQAAITAFGNKQLLGQRVVRNALLCDLIDVEGVIDVIDLEIGTEVGQLHALNIPIDGRSLASFDTSRNTITTET